MRNHMKGQKGTMNNKRLLTLALVMILLLTLTSVAMAHSAHATPATTLVRDSAGRDGGV